MGTSGKMRALLSKMKLNFTVILYQLRVQISVNMSKGQLLFFFFFLVKINGKCLGET